MSFTDRLQYLIDKSDITHKEIEQNTGVKNISHYKSGRVKPSYDAIIALADFFDVTTDWLLKGTGPSPEQRKSIPVFGDKDSFIELPVEMEADFAYPIKQDNMKLVGIDKGDLAFFRKTETPQSGQIIATHKINEAEVMALHFWVQKNGQAILRSANPDYEDILLTANDAIDGVLIALLKKVVPSLGDYERWSDIILLANQNGISPLFVKQFLEQQIRMSKTL